MTGRVVVFGGINMDLVVESPRLPRPGETVEGTRFFTTPGGKGANQAVAASRALGEAGRVHMVGRVGDDAYGKEMRDLLAADGINIDHVAVETGIASGVAVIFVDAHAQNTVTAVYGANDRCGGAEADAVASLCGPGDVLLVQQEVSRDATHDAMFFARRNGAIVILDPAPHRDDAGGLLDVADFATPNQAEAEALTGIAVKDLDSAARAAAAIRRQGIAGAIITLGELGCYADTADFSGHVPAFPVTAVSTLAAGDAFNGGLASALASGLPLIEAIRWGTATAALCVERPGAQAAMPTRDEVRTLLDRT